MGVKYDHNAVVIEEAPKLNYTHNYVCLPYDYGRESYENRADVKAIKATVRGALDKLDEATGWKAKFKGQKVLIKPNLVFVTPKTSYRYSYDIPQTTDPRVFDATMEVLSELCDDIVIGEGSGLVTWTYAKMAGYLDIAKKYNAKFVCFEELPTQRFFCPKAEVGQEVYVPDIIGEVIRGERLYVSHPKTKCNIYTGVTLGFKNSMGTYSVNMRARNHTWQINKKLTDIMYLFKPDLTVIDGIIGGEGNTPGPNDPVIFDRIICGTNAVEVDRVTTELMGFDPNENELIKEADKRGFGDPDVEIIGEKRVVPFRPAEPTLLSPRFKKNWPGVKEYVGYTNPHVPKVDKIDGWTTEEVFAMEQFDRGGTPSSLGTCFEVFFASYTYPLTKKRHLNVIVGEGAEWNGTKYWICDDGHAYTLEELEALPGMTVVVGENSAPAKSAATHPFFFIRGWGEVNNLAVRMALSMMPTLPGQADLHWLPWIGIGAVRKYLVKLGRAAMGQKTDMTYDAFTDGVYTIPELAEQNLDVDWIEAPLPPQDLKDRWQAIKETRILAQFLL
ncbi:MAG: DUF362 domain-containing protein [Acutalibacteraceae bacterium]|jgi:uncharacterized protein (DUF362 family)|nr:DUF362 domain-containing protein [Clostridia bacterium]MEE1188077.1 DUF362 domain-containing protein [Acutalibacteraceae bacterium]MEE3312501.1 DUF362 domain-containing protein [Acutalibacteraceae bacterium]